MPDLAAAIREAEEALARPCFFSDTMEPWLGPMRSLLTAAKATGAPACTSATIEGEPGHESCSVCGHPIPSDSCGALRRCGTEGKGGPDAL